MVAIDPPFRLRVLASTFTLLIPVAVTQWVMASGTPWWRLDFPSLVYPAGLAFVIIAFVRFGLLRGARSVLALGRILAALWVAGSYFLAFELGSLGQALLGTLLAGFFYVVFTLVGEVFDGPSYNSGIRWFEGAPRCIPGAFATLSLPEGEGIELKPSRIDGRSAYLVVDSVGALEGLKRKAGLLDGVLHYGGEQASFRASLVTVSRHPSASPRGSSVLGVGLEFAAMSADAGKVLGDLIERMRAHGCLDRDEGPALHLN